MTHVMKKQSARLQQKGACGGFNSKVEVVGGAGKMMLSNDWK